MHRGFGFFVRFVLSFIILLFFVSCEGTEKAPSKASSLEGLVQSRVESDGGVHLALVVAPKAPGEKAPDLSHLRGIDFLDESSGVRSQLDPERAPRLRGFVYARYGLWLLRNPRETRIYRSESNLGLPHTESYDSEVLYTSDSYIVYEGRVFEDGGESQELTFSNGNLTGTIHLRRSGDALYARFNDGSERRVYASGTTNNPIDLRVSFILPIEIGSFISLDKEAVPRYTGQWTVNATPKLDGPDPYNNSTSGDTPFDFSVCAFIIDNVTGIYRPDIPIPDSKETLCGGATFKATARTLGSPRDSAGTNGPLYWKAVVVPPGGGDPIRTLYGSAGSYNGDGVEIQVDWDGKNQGGQQVSGGKKYGVVLSAIVDEGDPPATPGEARGRLWTSTFGPPEADINPYEVRITPNPYIPYTPEELQYVYDADGYPVWPDDDGDGQPDRFPDHDGDGSPDFEPGQSPPGIHFTAYANRGGYDVTWLAEILSEDGQVLHTETSQFPNEEINFEWTPPQDLEPQTLKFRVSGTKCPKNTVDVAVLAQGTVGNCRPLAFEAEVAFGEKEGILEIFDDETDELLATSEPKPYAGGVDPLLAALDVVGLGTTINLGFSNDQVILKRRNANARLKIRYLVKKKDAEGKDSVELTIRTTASNPNGFTVNLPKKAIGTINIEFADTFTLTSSGSSGGKLIRITEPTGPTFSVYDYNSGKGGSDYASGDAQDGLEFEAGESGTQLGLAAQLTSTEKASKKYRAKKIPPIQNALIAGGFEDLIVERQNVMAWTRVKNQAQKLYLSTHGGQSGTVFGNDTSTGPDDIGEHWKDSLKLVIVAGCSIFNIGNFNDWETYKNSGSPGIGWRSKVKDDCMLLGYNATAPGADLGGGLYIDTRILIRYREFLPGQQSRYSNPAEAQAMAWLLANASMEHRQSDDACAITKDYYYFIHLESFDFNGDPILDPHDQSEYGIAKISKNRAIWRVHRSLWNKQGWLALKSVTKGSLCTLMRALPNAEPGQSDKI